MFFIVLAFLLNQPTFAAHDEDCVNKVEALNRKFHQKIEQTLLGIAVGDAFGLGLEMLDRDFIRAHIDFTHYVNHRSGEYLVGYHLGDYSDDTSDSLAVINTLLGPHGFTADELLGQIHTLYEESRSTRNGLARPGFGSIAGVFENRRTLEEVRNAQTNRPYPGNAPPMRAIPLGFLKNLSDVRHFALINADVSHPHPKARAASLAVALATRFLILENGEASQVIAHVRRFTNEYDKEMASYLRKVDQLPALLDEQDYSLLLGRQPVKIIKGVGIKGLWSDSMRTAGAALYILKYNHSAFGALKASIRMGGDVDTLAAITTGIAAGRYGSDDLPPFLLEGLEDREKIRSKSRDFSNWLIEKK